MTAESNYSKYSHFLTISHTSGWRGAGFLIAKSTRYRLQYTRWPKKYFVIICRYWWFSDFYVLQVSLGTGEDTGSKRQRRLETGAWKTRLRRTDRQTDRQTEFHQT